MLGKASEINVYPIEEALSQGEWTDFKEYYPDAEIIEIKYSSHYDESRETNWYTALIIYKEDKQC
ncbi:hypothetical protein D3C74_317620 [compost metagenome]